MWYGFGKSGVCCIKFKKDVLFSYVSKHINSKLLLRFWPTIMKRPSQFTINYWLSMWRYYGQKYCTSGEKNWGIVLETWPWTTSRSLEAITATHCVNRQKVNKHIKKSKNLSDSHSREAEPWFSPCWRDTEVLAYKKNALDGSCVNLRPKWGQQDWKNVTDYSVITKVKVMIFYTALSQGKKGGCITTTQNWKAIHLNVVTPLLPEIKNTRLNILLENAFSQFSGTTKASFTRCTWSKVQESTLRLMWRP